ncbi:helix-turn-helix domain-containing protein [Chitinophagaceae bacterium MMS25-I14]
MNVSNPIPQEKIAAYVERILVIENYRVTNPFTLPLFANGSPTLLFQSASGAIKNTATGNLMLFGQTVLPETLTITEDFTLIAYFFKPFALFSLFGVGASELTDNPADLDLLASARAGILKERLLNAGSVKEMCALLDNYIFSLADRVKKDSSIISFAANEIAKNSCSKETLISVQRKLCMTERTFQRMFERNVGVAPNLYRRICQFNNAFQQLNNHRYAKLSDIAFEHGFADQSHYIRSFKEFTSITPKDYIKFASQG